MRKFFLATQLALLTAVWGATAQDTNSPAATNDWLQQIYLSRIAQSTNSTPDWLTRPLSLVDCLNIANRTKRHDSEGEKRS